VPRCSRFFAVAFSILLILAPRAAMAQTDGPLYVVQPGDTLFAIALKFGTSVEALASANQIADPSSIRPGMELVLPGFEGITGRLTTKAVGYGETLGSLTLRYGISPEVLVRLNRIVNPGRLYLGQEVILSEQDATQLLVPNSRLLLAEIGEGRLSFAVRRGLRPWSFWADGASFFQAWALPGRPFRVPGGESPTGALPEPIQAVVVAPERAVQGRTLVVRLQLGEPALAAGRIGERQLTFHSLNSADLVTLQGIHALAEPGLYDLELALKDLDSGEILTRISQPIRVAGGGYPADPILNVPDETVDPINTQPEDQMVAALVTQSSEEKLWDGPFLFPTTYYETFSSFYGSRRNYNGLGYLWYHTGLDLFGSTQTEVYAPARGNVVFAGPLTVRGQATYIDHGWGVFTGYFHQSQILVSVGDLVEVGQKIGMVGATGRARGAHLHWEVWVGGVPVDPLEWTTNPLP